MEADEIREFTEQVREGGEKSLTHVSLIISILAVLVAMVTVLGHREHTEAVLLQTRAADQWNEYQSRKLRVQQLGVESDLLSLQPSSNPAAAQAKLSANKGQITKWQSELADGTAQARRMEDEVKLTEARAARFDLGEALLQIAVILASITLLTRRQMYVMAAVVLGLGGIAIGLSAFLLK
jgi:hypothetical protein